MTSRPSSRSMGSQGAQQTKRTKRTTSTEACSLQLGTEAAQYLRTFTIVHAQQAHRWALMPLLSDLRPNNGHITTKTIELPRPLDTTKTAASAQARVRTPLARPSSTTFSVRTDRALFQGRVWRGHHIREEHTTVLWMRCTSSNPSTL